MSKIGNHRVGIQETGSYVFGWNSAERGEPRPLNWDGPDWDLEWQGQCMGWDDYHQQQASK